MCRDALSGVFYSLTMTWSWTAWKWLSDPRCPQARRVRVRRAVL